MTDKNAESVVGPIPTLALRKSTIVADSKARAKADARYYYGAVAVVSVGPPKPSRTNRPQYVVTYLVVDTSPSPVTGWAGGPQQYDGPERP